MSALHKMISEEMNRKKCSSNSLATPTTTNSENDLSSSRKRSEDSLATKILKPSLRMKAYKDKRQDTFHSLDMHVDHTQEQVYFFF